MWGGGRGSNNFLDEREGANVKYGSQIIFFWRGGLDGKGELGIRYLF